jgi:hypothetical protein
VTGASGATEEFEITTGDTPTGSRARPLPVRLLGAACVLVVAGVAAAAIWPPRSVGPQATADPSWKYLLTVAAGEHLRYGRDLVFTYGPLGWLFSPTAASWRQLLASFVVTAAVVVGGFVALRFLLRRVLPALVCDAVVLVAAALLSVGTPELLATCVVLAVLAVLVDRPRTVRLWTVGAVGLLGGTALTMKFGLGELLLAVGVPLALVSGRGSALARAGRGLVAWAVAGVVGFAVAWFATSQHLGDIAGFVRGSVQIQRGYQTAAVLNEPRGHWQVLGDGIGFVALVLFCVVSVVAARGNRRRAAAAAAVALIGVWYELLQAFVRQDAVHDIAGQGLATLVAVAFLAGSRGLQPTAGPDTPDRGRRRSGAVLAVVCAACFVGTYLASGPPTLHRFAPPSRVRLLRTDVDRIRYPARQTAATARALRGLRVADPYPAAVVTQLAGHAATPVPTDIDGMAAWGIRPVTLPVPQTYSAYTTYLDRLDAAALLRPDAPPVLRRIGSVRGGPDPMWASPEFMTTLLCHYRQDLLADRYQVLVRAPQRCAVSPSVLTTVHVRPGELVRIPHPSTAGDGVVLTVTAHPSLIERVLAVVARAPRPWLVRIDGHMQFRLDPDSDGQPLVVVVPAGLWSPTTTVGGDDTTLRFSGTPDLTLTFRELVRTPAG